MDVSLIETIDSEVGLPALPRPEGFGVTVHEYMEIKGCSETMARKLLEKGVKLGVLDKQQMISGSGTAPFVYFKKEK